MNTLKTNFEGNNTTVLKTNKNILLNIFKLNKEKTETVNGLPFYSGGEFKLPESYDEATNIIENISKKIDSIAESKSFVDSNNKNSELEKETSDDSKTYKKLLIKGIIIIHWQLNYLNNDSANKPTRVDFILKILEKLLGCSKNYWGIDSEYTSTTITRVLTSLLNGDELDIVIMNFPTKALHIYGW